jgi:DNA-binding response OmpR family regulator
MLTRVWGLSSGGVETRTIDMHIARLRAKLEEISQRQADELIVTVRGKGYMLGDGVKMTAKGGQ